MPARYRRWYRCCWCGSAVSPNAKTMREHIVERHRRALKIALRPIEAYGTREREIASLKAAMDRPERNPGVSGEGDS